MGWKNIPFLFLLLLFCTGCNEETEPQPDPSQYGELIIGTTRINTKALDDSFEPYDEIGLFAIHNEVGELLPAGNYADNIRFDLQADGFTWRGNETVYFAPDGSGLDLIAYYPFDDQIFKDESSTVIHFRVEEDQSNYQNYTNSDLVIADRYNVMPTTQKVNLTFDHQLSQITFALQAGEGYEDEEYFNIEEFKNAEISLRNVIIDGKIDLANGNSNDVELQEERGDITPYTEWGRSEDDPFLLYGAKLITIPQELNENSYLEIRLNDRTFIKRFTNPIRLHSGESTLFTVTINNREIEISTTLNPWNSGGDIWIDTDELPELLEAEALILEVTIDELEYQGLTIRFESVVEKINIVIDWGDNTGPEIIKNSTDEDIYHDYAKVGIYHVKIYGNTDLIRVEGNSFTSILQWGDLKVKSWDNAFYANNYLTSIPPHMPDAESFDYVFFTCPSLKELPEGLFDDCITAKSFNCTFLDCIELETIPEGLFQNCVGATSFAETFANCEKLKEIPKDVFKYCTNAIDFGGTFNACFNITSISEGLFENCINAENFYNTFGGCSNLLVIPENLFDNCEKVTDFANTFSGCTSLTGKTPNTNGIEIWERHLYPQYPSEIAFHYCFYGCTLLENYDEIPADVK